MDGDVLSAGRTLDPGWPAATFYAAGESSGARTVPEGAPPGRDPPGNSGNGGDDFAGLVREHQEALLARATRLCADRAQASDLVQDTFERALRNFDAFERGTNGRAWLMTIMARLFIDQLRKRKIATEVQTLDHDELPAEPPAEELKVTSQQLHAAIAALPDELRQVIELHELQGLAYRDIEERFAIPKGTIGTRLSRARTKLHAVLRALVEAV
jgi:RNA polymerase sigma-70 factor (ECF subfamily)